MRPETKALYPEHWAVIQKAVIKRRGKVCADCGAKKGHTRRILTVHHQDYDPSNNALSNLDVLCQGCHLRRRARDLSYATKVRNLVLLVRMGQLWLPGLELIIPKNLARVTEGMALATSPRTGYRARQGSGR